MWFGGEVRTVLGEKQIILLQKLIFVNINIIYCVYVILMILEMTRFVGHLNFFLFILILLLLNTVFGYRWIPFFLR